MRFTKFSAVLATAGLALVALSACSTDSSGGASGSDATDSSDAPSVGFVAFDMSNSTTIGIWNGIDEQVASLGGEATVIDSAGSPDKAIQAIQTLVQKGVDVIFTGVFPPQALAAGLDAAKTAHIPVASFGGGVGDGTLTDWSFGTKPGTESAKIVLDLTDGEGDLLMLGYKPGTPCLTREESFLAGIDGENDFSIERQEIEFPGQVEVSQKYTQAWLSANPSDSADAFTVWACTDDAAIGAVSAVQQAGRDDVHIVSIDGTPQAIKAVQNGSIDAVVWIDGYGTGKAAIEDLDAIIDRGVDGDTVEGDAKYQIVDKSNIDDFLAEHPEALGN